MPGRIAAQLARSFEDARRRARRRTRASTAARSSRAGINYGTSFEIALKIRELSGLLFEA